MKQLSIFIETFLFSLTRLFSFVTRVSSPFQEYVSLICCSFIGTFNSAMGVKDFLMKYQINRINPLKGFSCLYFAYFNQSFRIIGKNLSSKNNLLIKFILPDTQKFKNILKVRHICFCKCYPARCLRFLSCVCNTGCVLSEKFVKDSR